MKAARHREQPQGGSIEALETELGDDAQRVGAAIWGRMLFPSQERAESLLALGYGHMLLVEREIFMPHRAAHATAAEFMAERAMPRRDLLMAYRFWAGSDRKADTARFDEGFSAGAVLKTFLALHRANPSTASLSKSFTAVSAMVRDLNRTDSAPGLRIGEKTLERRWSRFKSVAHLWAAAGHLLESWETPDGRLKDDPGLAIQVMLGAPSILCTLAINYLRRASEAEIAGSEPRVRLLSPSHCWLVPKRFYERDWVDLDPQNHQIALPDSAKRALAEYRHR